MLFGKTITCIIPAKGSSLRVSGKNLRLCDGVPLVAHAYRLAVQSEIFDDIIVSTESEKVYDAVHEMGYRSIYRRPAELANSSSSVWDAVQHAVQWTIARYPNTYFVSDYVCLLHPTSPCVTVQTVHMVMMCFAASGIDAIATCTKTSPYTFRGGQIPDFSGALSSDTDTPYYSLNNAISAVTWEVARTGKNLWKTNIECVAIPPDEAIDIDTERDLYIAEAILQWRRRNAKVAKSLTRPLHGVRIRNDAGEGRDVGPVPEAD